MLLEVRQARLFPVCTPDTILTPRLPLTQLVHLLTLCSSGANNWLNANAFIAMVMRRLLVAARRWRDYPNSYGGMSLTRTYRLLCADR